MDFKKRLKMRLYLAIGYLVLGVLIIIVANVTKTENQFLYVFGTLLVVFGIARIRRYFRNTKDEKTIRALEIKETDERNIEIMEKAKSLTFNVSLFIIGIAVIILQLIGVYDVSIYLGYGLGFIVFVYWICYAIIRKKY